MVYIDQVPFKTSLYGKALTEALVLISDAAKVAVKLDESLRKVAGKHSAKECHLSERILNTPKSRLYSAIQANKKIKPSNRVSLEHCLSLSESAPLTAPLKEQVLVYPKIKSKGGFRAICKFGIQHRMFQNIVVRTLGPYHSSKSWQYTFAGHNKAIRKAKKALGDGLVYYASLDIKNHYSSFDDKKLVQELPLRKELAEYVAIGRHIKAVADVSRVPIFFWPLSPQLLLQEARQGIAQGSTSSPLIAAYVMHHLDWINSSETVLINFADNFLLLAATEQLLQKEVGKLEDAMSNLPGGNFITQILDIGKASKSFDFLGHTLRCSLGKVFTSIKLSHQDGAAKLFGKTDEKIAQLIYCGKNNKQKALELLIEFYRQVNGWVNAFS